MKNLNKILLGSLVIASFVVIVSVAFLSKPTQFGSGTSTQTFGGNVAVLGDLAITGNTTTTGNEVVSGNSTVTGNLTVGGTQTFTGTSTFSGVLSGIPTSYTITMTSATNTPCAIQNTSGLTRVVIGVNALFTSTASAGAVSLVAGTSTGSTVTSTSPFINTTITKSASLDVGIPTTTLETLVGNTSSTFAYPLWRTSEWMVWNSGSTSTHAGTCKVLTI